MGDRSLLVGVAVLLVLQAEALAAADPAPVIFFDDFEAGPGKWEISDSRAVRIVDSQDRTHGKVLLLWPRGPQEYALMRGSQRWRGYRIEGEVLFPTREQNYLGLIYHWRRKGERIDLGSIYLKGNGSYLRVNPHRDWNPARRIYEELKVRLRGRDAIRIGRWHRFAAEVLGPVCHFYVGDLKVPKVTFDYFEHTSGKAGFKPRVVGGPVWIDNIRVTAIDGLGYRGPRRPLGIRYRPGASITKWQVLGPLTRTSREVESARVPTSRVVRQDGRRRRWRPFPTDPRGAVLTGRVVDFLGPRTVAYFATTVQVPPGVKAALEISTIDQLALWRNGIFDGYWSDDRYAWHDFGVNPAHRVPGGRLPLKPGVHHVLLRVRGGQYASGGFFARVAKRAAAAAHGAAPTAAPDRGRTTAPRASPPARTRRSSRDPASRGKGCAGCSTSRAGASLPFGLLLVLALWRQARRRRG